MAGKSQSYKRKITRQLYFSNLLSCAELSHKIDKSLSLTTKILNELIAEGIVVETGYAPSSGGRRPLMYSLRADVLYIVSVAMDQFFTRIAIMDMQNKHVCAVEKFELRLADNPAALAVLTNKIESVIKQSGISKTKIAGIGIGMPGFVDSQKGINYTFLPATGESITDYIAGSTGLHTYIENDSGIVGLAELRFGAVRNRKNAMVINIGWGVGLGMILEGALFRGDNGFAGEFSHIPLFNNGKLCSCGKSGCLETETSLFVIVEKAKEGMQAGRVSALKRLLSGKEEDLEKDAEAIIHSAGKGDRFAIELLSEAGYNIGRGIAILIHLLNPGIVVLSGRGALAGKIWQAPIQQALNEHCIPRLAINTEIAISTLGYEAELIGCAALVMEKLGEPVKKSFKKEKIPKAARLLR
ncbi:ROK family protein [Agriterribacter sp.]|uniref:ROK family protein n=1 Tax=Agriterribacter sp. TaxID=2821509 RepID=UPI002BA6E216|nr:ROK family protein [Agriterribacter sp.]HRO44839.1 ROK family protein [Agriterribacter sp.]HRQ18582.1 ROK family protein [Agriterribacter sp.]